MNVEAGRVAYDLRTLTARAEQVGLPIAPGGLGGEFGYGAYVDNDVFEMHPYCWCEEPQCRWCCPCTCETFNLDQWSDLLTQGHDVDLSVDDGSCATCTGQRVPAANFHHKATGVQVRWYKYIGRGMSIWTGDEERPAPVRVELWDEAFTSALRSLGA